MKNHTLKHRALRTEYVEMPKYAVLVKYVISFMSLSSFTTCYIWPLTVSHRPSRWYRRWCIRPKVLHGCPIENNGKRVLFKPSMKLYASITFAMRILTREDARMWCWTRQLTKFVLCWESNWKRKSLTKSVLGKISFPNVLSYVINWMTIRWFYMELSAEGEKLPWQMLWQ